jgi:hypothetical protein
VKSYYEAGIIFETFVDFSGLHCYIYPRKYNFITSAVTTLNPTRDVLSHCRRLNRHNDVPFIFSVDSCIYTYVLHPCVKRIVSSQKYDMAVDVLYDNYRFVAKYCYSD